MKDISCNPCCYGNLVDMATRVKPPLLLCLKLYCIHIWYEDSMGHQSYTSLLWKLRCHGNQSETSITYLS